MRDLGDKFGALLVQRSLDGVGLADCRRLVAVAIALCTQLLTNFSLSILKLRFEQAELLKLNLELLGGLLVLAVVVGHGGRAIRDCGL